MNANLLPEEVILYMWASCAVALDGCIYFMPYNADRIINLDPNNNDTMSSVGDDLGDDQWKYIGTVVETGAGVENVPQLTSTVYYRTSFDPSENHFFIFWRRRRLNFVL